MDYLYICNMASDYISKINIRDLLEEKRISLSNKTMRVGPHGICAWKSDLITANSYGNSISRIDMISEKEMEDYYIGRHCNDVDVYDNVAYIICGESNSMIAFDLISSKIIEEIPCGNLPHSIQIEKGSGLIAVANMESDSITLVDCKSKETIKELKVGAYPTKAVFCKDHKKMFVCESNLGSDKRGAISIISLETLKIVDRIDVGKGPVDICCDESVCYVSNFSEGTVSVIYLEDKEEVKKIYLGGMPRGIVKKGRYLYVGDNYSNLLIRYDIYKDEKKAITIGGEPTGMTLV